MSWSSDKLPDDADQIVELGAEALRDVLRGVNDLDRKAENWARYFLACTLPYLAECLKDIGDLGAPAWDSGLREAEEFTRDLATKMENRAQ